MKAIRSILIVLCMVLLPALPAASIPRFDGKLAVVPIDLTDPTTVTGGSSTQIPFWDAAGGFDFSSALTFDGSDVTVPGLIVTPDDGNNGAYFDDNPVGAGGYDCAGNAPAAGDFILNADSNSEAGVLHVCLPDGVNYQVPMFSADATKILSGPSTDWSIDDDGIAHFKNIRFHNGVEDAAFTVEFARLNVQTAGSDVTNWVPTYKFSLGTTNGVAFTENVLRMEIDSANGVELFSGDDEGGGAAMLKFWDLDNTTGSVELYVDDVINAEVRLKLPVANSTLVAADTTIEETFSTTDFDPVDADDHFLFKLDYLITLTGLECIITGTTSIPVTIDVCNSAGASCASSDATATCDADGATDAATTGIAADSWIKLVYGAESGTPTTATTTIQYTRAANP